MSKPRIALLIGVVCISIFPILVKLNLTSGLISAFYRMGIAALFLVPYAVYTKQMPLYSAKMMSMIVLCGVLFGSDVAVWNIAIQESTATQATLLTNLAPVWVGIGSYLFLSTKPTVNFWIGTAIALVGMLILIDPEVFVDFAFDRAFAFGLLSGLFYACYIILSKKVLGKVPVVSFMAYSLSASTLFLGVCNYFARSAFSGFSVEAWGVLLVQGVVCQLIAWLLLSYATKHMRATRVSLSLLSQAPLAALMAWLFLGEAITLPMIVGGLILLCGIGLTFSEKPYFFRRNEKN